MVTARETADSKVIAMDDRAGGTSVPPRTLLEEVNAHLVCALCGGYYIDATTIVECLHSFCRSCIIKHLQAKSYCPVCEMMINSAKPNIKPDKALQDIVYKLVPGLFQREMRRRQAFYSSRPGPAASATPEQRGEDTERIIFSPEDVISFSLEYIDCVEAESASSRSSESGNESAPCNEAGAPTRRYLQCPAVVNVSHLKKFLSMKYDIDAAHFFVEILYKRVPLPDYYTLMDIAYIYNWKRNEPMRFFYQITDFSVIRDRFGFFGVNRPGGHARRGKASPPVGEVTAPDSPAPLTEGSSDCSEGSRSPPPPPSAAIKTVSGGTVEPEIPVTASEPSPPDGSNVEPSVSARSSPAVDVEKSQFLNSFELTAKSSVGKTSCSPLKEEVADPPPCPVETKPAATALRSPVKRPKTEATTSPGKRKSLPPPEEPIDVKKPRLLADKNVKNIPVKTAGKANASDALVKSVADALAENCSPQSSKPHFSFDGSSAGRGTQTDPNKSKMPTTSPFLRPNRAHDRTLHNASASTAISPSAPDPVTTPTSATTAAALTPASVKVNLDDVTKKCLPAPSKLTMKRKAPDGQISQSHPADRPGVPARAEQATATAPPSGATTLATPKTLKTAVDTLRPGLSTLPKVVNKTEPVRRLPEIPGVIPKRPDPCPLRPPRPPMKLNIPKPPKGQGDPLKTLFDSCNINIPSSLSITLTDQKSDSGREDIVPTEAVDPRKADAAAARSVPADRTDAPSPPAVHNYIEILKLPDLESSKPSEGEKNVKPIPNKSGDATATAGAKGPVPKLKPIGDAKQAKAGPFAKPKTFQQTFLQSLQQQCEKPKYLKTRIEYPKINAGASPSPSTPVTTSSAAPLSVGAPSHPAAVMAPAVLAAPPTDEPQERALPAVPAPVVAKSKPVPVSQPVRKFCNIQSKPAKLDSALDLSTPHAAPSQLGPQQTKALETMQSIADLAKKQSFTQRMASPSQVFSQESFKMNASPAAPLRIPVPPPKHPKTGGGLARVPAAASPKHAPDYYPSTKATAGNGGRPSDGGASHSKGNPTAAAYVPPSHRSLTRSPSSSPKLVIACSSPKSRSPERKRLLSPRTVDNGSQSNLISSSQISSTNHAAPDAPGGSRETVKPPRAPAPVKPPNPRATGPASRPGSYAPRAAETGSYPSEMSPQQVYILQQLELQTRLGFLPPGAAAQWYNNPAARAHFERIMKNNPQ